MHYHVLECDTAVSSVFGVKRLIGRNFDDAEVQSDIKHFPFKVLNKAGKPYIEVEFNQENKEFVKFQHSHDLIRRALIY